MTDGTGNATMTCFTPKTEGLIKDVNTLLNEVADKSPKIIPQQITALENTRHVFQFKFAKPIGKGPPTFVLQKVMDHIPATLGTLTEGPSSPPPASPTDQEPTPIMTPLTAPPASQETPTDADATTNLPIASNVRRVLFTTSVEQESDRESKKQKTE